MTSHNASTDIDTQPDLLAHAGRVADVLQDFRDAGLHPVHCAEIALFAALPWILEFTREPTIEAALQSLAKRFDGNQIRPRH